MSHRTIRNLFILAGLSNILGVLICSKLFTNHVMMEAQASVIGAFGIVAIILWGLAYISVSKNYNQVRGLIGVFVIEKLAYVLVWIKFISTQSLKAIYEQDILAGVFYTIYGVNDLIFMLFFSYVFLNINKKS